MAGARVSHGCRIVLGPRAVALRNATDPAIAEAKRRFLDASNADGRDGAHTTGVRWWILFRVRGCGLTPAPDPQQMRQWEVAAAMEDSLEDFAVRLATFRPSRRPVSGISTYRRCGGALSTAFSGLISDCEIAVDAARGEVFSPDQHLLISDVRELPSSSRAVTLRMRKRKDLRVLHGKHDTVYLAGGGNYIDAPRSLKVWIAARREAGISEAAPLFCHASGASITVCEVRAEVKRCMGAVGEPPHLYGAHSLRIGVATAALAAGSALAVGVQLSSAEVDPVGAAFHEENLELQLAEVASCRRETNEQVDEDEFKLLPVDMKPRETRGIVAERSAAYTGHYILQSNLSMAEGTSPPLSALRSLLSAREERPPPPPPLASRELEAAIRLDRPLLASLLARSDDISSPDFTRRALPARGHSGCVARMLAAHVSPDAGDSHMTPLSAACEGGHAVCVQWLIAAGAQLELGADKTPLSLACSLGHESCAEWLILAHANIEASDASGWRPLHEACERGSLGCVSLLLAARASPEEHTLQGQTPAELARAQASSALFGFKRVRLVCMLLVAIG
ncbi:MAG: hypothetical protein SGPRY_009317 [Prymnesium sp.]